MKGIIVNICRFIVRRESNKKAVAASLSFDVYDGPSNRDHSKEINYAMGFLGINNKYFY